MKSGIPTTNHAQLARRAARKFQLLYGRVAAACQPNPLSGFPKTIVTTFFDVEGDYAAPGQHRACIETIYRILEIEKKYGIHSTYNIVARFALDFPDALSALNIAGHEIASHSYDHTVLRGLSSRQLSEDVGRAKTALSDLGVQVVGFRSPQSTWSRRLVRVLFREGFKWSAENGRELYPYRLLSKGAAVLWRFPVTTDDWCYMRDRVTPDEALNTWKLLVRRACDTRRYTAIGFHPWVEAASGRLTAFDEFLHWISEQSDVQVMPFGRVLGLIQERRHLDSST
jgi:peptidoglycan/xylan/chitin deacetylase (PgdA/CDA1 family)